MGYPRRPLEFDYDIRDALLAAHEWVDDEFIWIYTSPEFPMAQVSYFTCLAYLLLSEKEQVIAYSTSVTKIYVNKNNFLQTLSSCLLYIYIYIFFNLSVCFDASIGVECFAFLCILSLVFHICFLS